MNRALLNARIKIALVRLLQSTHIHIEEVEDMKLTERQKTIMNIGLVEVQLADIRKAEEEHYKDKY